MNIQKQLELINSLELNQRIEHINDLFIIVSEFEILKGNNETEGLSIIDCLKGIRSSKFIESDVDLRLLDASLMIARNLKNQQKLLIGLLNDAVYYSAYYPKKYNKSELEKEITEIKNSTT